MGRHNATEQKEMEKKYSELVASINEMEGDDKEQVEDCKAVLIALVNEALDID